MGDTQPLTFPLTKDESAAKAGSRQRTDAACCLAFLVTVGIMGTMIGVAFVRGDTHRLTHGIDHQGLLCGIDEGVADKPYLYYCGTNDWPADDEYPKALDYASTSCVESCPEDGATTVECLTPALVNFTRLGPDHVKSINFTDTLNLEITQSITEQKSYPTIQYKDTYCLPKSATLKSTLENGPMRHHVRVLTAWSSFKHAWFVVLIAACLAVILGLLYLYVLKNFAGLLIFISLWASTILMFLLGVFFLIGIFPDPADDDGTYQKLSPVFRLCFGNDARAWSGLLGLICCASGVCMLFNTLNQNIDESIGVIDAATDCLWSSMAFWIQPIFGGIIMIALVCVLISGYMMASTVSNLNTDMIEIDGGDEDVTGQSFDGLQAQWEQDWWWRWLLHFYIFGSIWLCLVCLAIGHYTTMYTVAAYFCKEGTEEESQESKDAGEALKLAAGKRGKSVGNVRVNGVGASMGGPRSGQVVKGAFGKVLVVPLGEPGPDGRDGVRLKQKVLVKNIAFTDLITGVATGMTYHLGSLALGAWVSTLTSPFRFISMILKSFLANSERGSMDEDQTSYGLFLGGLGLLATFIDEFFGCYSKNLYSEIVLNSQSFWEASAKVNDFVAESGGTVALLHGGTALYEIIGVMVITFIVGLTTFICMNEIDFFANNPEIDTSYITILTTVLTAFIASNFMAVFNMTADGLLYVFSWSRLHRDRCGNIDKLCPTPLRHIVRAEIEEAPKESLQPQARANRMNKYSHAASKYKDKVMATMRTGVGKMTEQRPLLSSVRGGP